MHIEFSTLVIATASAVIIFAICETLYFIRLRIDAHKIIPEDPTEIDYPMEPMFDNYISIITALMNCKSELELSSIYIRILVFQGCYKIDSQRFYDELIEFYKQAEKTLLKSNAG